MILEVENRAKIESPTRKDIERALRSLKSEGPSSYASLTSPSGSYVQVGGGRFTCLLEKRGSSDGAQYRAYSNSPSVPFPDGSILSFSGGDIPLRNDEWFNIEKAIELFVAFASDADLPNDIFWREIAL
ncbi:hypothetical protein [Microbulbifer sp. JTAC008]|uniref:hypothetical protein n=1 Tax=unclassified Microbulbifer TaxID=2619833 RepID=UPI00403A6755